MRAITHGTIRAPGFSWAFGLSATLGAKFLLLWEGAYSGDNLKSDLDAAVITTSAKDWDSKYISDTDSTFAAPDNATYIAADTDNFWFTSLGVQNQVTFDQLIASETLRTFVKYSDFEPWKIYAIGILKADATLTEADKDELTRYFKLWPTYFGDMREFGYMKDNRIFDSEE